jgi:hypothetical protein
MLGSWAHKAHGAKPSSGWDTEPWQPEPQVARTGFRLDVGWAREAVLKFGGVVWTLGCVVGWERADKALRGWGCERLKPLTPTEPE